MVGQCDQPHQNQSTETKIECTIWVQKRTNMFDCDFINKGNTTVLRLSVGDIRISLGSTHFGNTPVIRAVDNYVGLEVLGGQDFIDALNPCMSDPSKRAEDFRAVIVKWACQWFMQNPGKFVQWLLNEREKANREGQESVRQEIRNALGLT